MFFEELQDSIISAALVSLPSHMFS